MEEDRTSLIIGYELMFGEKPPVLMIAGYDDIMLKLIENAIRTNKPLTKEDVDNAYKDIPVDIDFGNKPQFQHFKKGE